MEGTLKNTVETDRGASLDILDHSTAQATSVPPLTADPHISAAPSPYRDCASSRLQLLSEKRQGWWAVGRRLGMGWGKGEQADWEDT